MRGCGACHVPRGATGGCAIERVSAGETLEAQIALRRDREGGTSEPRAGTRVVLERAPRGRVRID
jgi:hypothetical protein